MQALSAGTCLLCLLTAFAFYGTSGVAHAEDNFVLRFVQANGGCGEHAPLLSFDSGAKRRGAPFGKPAEEWTDGDLVLLKSAMAQCVPKPNGFDLGQENEIVKRVIVSIDDGRRIRQQRAQYAAARRRMAEAQVEADRQRDLEWARHQEESAALQELRGFEGHIISDAERERAQELKEKLPRLTARIDSLMLRQSTLKRDADEQRRRTEEREQASQRIKAQEAKRLLQEKRAEQEAAIEAERKQEAFVQALPASCKEADKNDGELDTGAVRSSFERAMALADAGDAKAACTSFTDYVSKLEKVRSGLIQCTKDLDANLDNLAREAALRALNRAAEIYGKQKTIKQKSAEFACG